MFGKFKALYGQPPRLHLPYMAGDSELPEEDRSLITREFKLQPLKLHLTRAQQRMEPQVNKKRGLTDNSRKVTGFSL